MSLTKRTAPLLLILALFLTGCGGVDGSGYPISDTTGRSIGKPLPVTVNNTVPVITSNSTSTVNATVFAQVETTGKLVVPYIDKTTGVLVMVDQVHTEIHEGTMFSVCNVTDLTSSGNMTFLLITPNSTNGLIHIVFDVETESEAEYQLWENSTISNNGTAVTPINRNRSIATTAATKVFYTPTITSLGATLCTKHWGSGKGVGGGDRSIEEWVLKANTNYIIRVTNFTVNANHATLEMVWYQQASAY